eukprot:TRINITY_DN1184_c0_g1_i2.p1 TRINITY_DN1184_c0_g1~~TRINITY_DN1184_c0_g1_i2.p1  ORF type:complete len:152 (+),score=22.87 TRINITY_DN1184_c0_g1_i2:95-550(+)
MVKISIACPLVLAVFVRVNGDRACNNTADLKIYDVIKNNISNVQKDCILNGAPGADWTQHCLKKFIGSVESGQACMSDCVHKRVNLSTSCSACFGSISACVFEKCVSHCLDATAPACIDCTAKNCEADFVTCTGFTHLPPAVFASHDELVV